MKYREASNIAVGICRRLMHHCEPDRINIAGSIRRKKAEVKDIEIICLPLRHPAAAPGLFEMNEPTATVHCKAFQEVVASLGTVLKGKPDTGRYMQIALPQGINLDLFMPQPHDYFRQYAIRTGPADYSARVIAVAWRVAGWVGTPDGLRRETDCRRVNDSTWEITAVNPTPPPVWVSEADFFNFIGLDWISPEKRIV